jgi:hypothetical protein
MAAGDFMETLESTRPRRIRPAGATFELYIALRRGLMSEYPDPSTCALSPADVRHKARRFPNRGRISRVVKLIAFIMGEVA